jgi:hypothetical protein
MSDSPRDLLWTKRTFHNTQTKDQGENEIKAILLLSK